MLAKIRAAMFSQRSVSIGLQLASVRAEQFGLKCCKNLEWRSRYPCGPVSLELTQLDGIHEPWTR